MLIKKYGNRRLYDTEASCYITLEELSSRIQGGADVLVIDAKTGQDLTQVTLAQIILESRGAAKLLPVPLLKQLVRMGDDALAEFFGRYMAWALDVYVHMRQGAQAIMPWNPFSALPILSQNPFARMFGGVMPWSEAPRQAPGAGGAALEPEPPQDDDAAQRREDVAALRREVDELKRALGRRSRK